MPERNIEIITFYQFKKLEDPAALKEALTTAMQRLSVFGTIVVAGEGFNSTVGGEPANIKKFVAVLEKIFATRIVYKSSFYEQNPFKRIFVKIKPEIVTLKKKVEIEKGEGTHVAPKNWNKIVEDEEVLLLDARNDYEFRVGTFRGAVNPQIEKFSDLPGFVEENLDPEKHKKIAVFCTGGIRCEKFAPYLREKGFEQIFQLEGGILKYLEEIPEDEQLWQGECFVFDRRITVDEKLRKGKAEDLSVKLKTK
jgi:UPF0176 protein